jgi:hypothetical protein
MYLLFQRGGIGGKNKKGFKMTKNIGEGLLILAANGYNQVSCESGMIYAGGKNLPVESINQLEQLDWWYDSDFDSWVYDTVDNSN